LSYASSDLADVYPFFSSLDGDSSLSISAEEWARVIFSEAAGVHAYTKDEMYAWYLYNAVELCENPVAKIERDIKTL